MKVLVTGGSGFIGSHVVDRLFLAGTRPSNLRPPSSPPYHDLDTSSRSSGRPSRSAAFRDAVRGCDASSISPRSRMWPRPGRPGRAEAWSTPGALSSRSRQRDRGCRAGSSTPAPSGSMGLQRRRSARQRTSPLSLPGHLYTATKLAGEMVLLLVCGSFPPQHDDPRASASHTAARARPAMVLASFVEQALCRRADHDRRRRDPITPVRVRGGSCRGVVAALSSSRGPCTTSSARSRSRESDRRHRTCGSCRHRADRPCRGASRRPQGPKSRDACASRARMGRAAAFPDGVARYIDWVTASRDRSS